VSKGVRRYLLLSGSGIEKGDAVQGKVHEYLDRCGAYSIAPNLVHLRVLSEEFKWHTIDRCYFTENFGTSFYHTRKKKSSPSSRMAEYHLRAQEMSLEQRTMPLSPRRVRMRSSIVDPTSHLSTPKPGRIRKSLIGCCNVERSSGMGDYSQEGKNWPCTLPSLVRFLNGI